MIRICNSLSNAGYKVSLIGRERKKSISLLNNSYHQKRLYCFFEKGKLFYVEYNLKLFIYLLFVKCDCICAIDLDTIVPVYLATAIRNKKRIYDAHELFCEMKEIVTRTKIYGFWKKIESVFVPKFTLGYTVNEPIAAEFKRMYGCNYTVVRNIAKQQKDTKTTTQKQKFILYQGAINEGRSFETIIPAMLQVNTQLILCGEGNFMDETKALVEKHQLGKKVIFKNLLTPESLRTITNNAYIGLTIFENKGLSNYYSLANRFFDYVNSYTPQVCVNYPVYAALNTKYKVALMIDDTDFKTISNAMNELLDDGVLWNEMHENCKLAAKEWNWENEEKILINFYSTQVFG